MAGMEVRVGVRRLDPRFAKSQVATVARPVSVVIRSDQEPNAAAKIAGVRVAATRPGIALTGEGEDADDATDPARYRPRRVSEEKLVEVQ